MNSKSKVPDAWDDEWVNNADQAADLASESSQIEVKLTKAERKRRQAELNKKLWDEAEAPDAPYLVQTRNDVPLQSGYAPSFKVLSRKPTPTVVSRRDPVSGLEQLHIEDGDDDEEDEEGDTKAKSLTSEERQLKAQKEREEKQRKYEEVRQRLFGTSSTSTGTRSPGSLTPPMSSRSSVAPAERGRGRGRGTNNGRSGPSRQLYDPDSVFAQKKQVQKSNSGTSTPIDETIIRPPRGPDGSGRGGIGFTHRGGRGAASEVDDQ